MTDRKELIRKNKFTLFSISAGIVEIILFTFQGKLMIKNENIYENCEMR